MRYKATFLVGFGTGYVLGTKAGRQRYEQIMRSFRQFTGRPEVQEAAGLVEGKAESLFKTAKTTVSDKLHKGDKAKTGTPSYAGAATTDAGTGTSSTMRDPYPAT
jgi:hypothetical protein